ncbi:hypothetical protein CKAH01_15583 [Colletotrichum kahawae]|uniref:Uncharacterized protein n=1 Tax=Colletotrichum kahawae TaxID=34407 RepID=A0AAD9YIE6_COLKA|nr:hypothetical protein CKAH01_15583 [Colletotrichum kahawae]
MGYRGSGVENPEVCHVRRGAQGAGLNVKIIFVCRSVTCVGICLHEDSEGPSEFTIIAIVSCAPPRSSAHCRRTDCPSSQLPMPAERTSWPASSTQRV